jgi:hypothetical protein
MLSRSVGRAAAIPGGVSPISAGAAAARDAVQILRPEQPLFPSCPIRPRQGGELIDVIARPERLISKKLNHILNRQMAVGFLSLLPVYLDDTATRDRGRAPAGRAGHGATAAGEGVDAGG